ncbi:hypothetical protein SCC4092_0208400 [Aggregatibacter actinomycetemcomitans serotype b str. SCC4092]|uniref:hypothetical protein n=1 Tax=Aggregatibacter actinomycetemcomitans TaxID=714 RepID=UPI00022AC80E|nr:hypothetical protein [Aggregatibacter actinomycetemcomitans]KND83611.1 hypothetical protein SCC1398_0204770 [Aggregatibacter actinomycetemcomitans serotype b str. SCC1398]KOE52831.1 hypothetical protein SCC4092_0208400 [Aggregatibacter actinomycetemcomitans serotype b str. SCC4092]
MENSNLPTGPRQGVLDISIDKEAEINGIGMGVLGNGIPYLTQTGLAKVCDISRITLQELSSEWTSSIQSGLFTTNRMTFLSSYLFNRGFSNESLYIQVEKNGAIHYAYPDIVCMAILEFYAFESSKSDKTVAQRSYRELASLGLKEYIYRSTGYLLHNLKPIGGGLRARKQPLKKWLLILKRKYNPMKPCLPAPRFIRSWKIMKI